MKSILEPRTAAIGRLAGLVFVFLVFSLPAWGQTEQWQALRDKAREYSLQKDYAKSNECYEQLIALLEPYDTDHSLTDKMRGLIALNCINAGVPLFKSNKYAEAKPWFDKALEYSARDPKVFPVANSWLGNWYSSQAAELSGIRSKPRQAIEYNLLAEEHYLKANAPEKALQQTVARAANLNAAGETAQALSLLEQVIARCEKGGGSDRVLARALNEKGAIELAQEDYRQAIATLERAYDLAATADKSCAYSAAFKLQNLYETKIPDTAKARLWKQRADEMR